MKKLIFIIAFVLAAGNSMAADSLSHWKFGGTSVLNFSQTSLTNWAGGGKDATNIAALLSLNSIFDDSTSRWETQLDMGYGVTQLDNESFKKSDDKIDFTSKFGYNAAQYLKYSARVNFLTQFYRGYNYNITDSLTGKNPIISNFLSPAYLSIGLGMNYTPAEYFSIMLSPCANRLIIVMDEDLSNRGAFGVQPGENFKSELGASLNLNFNKEVFTNVNIRSALSLFSQYAKLTSSVVNWDNLISMKINSFLSASVTTSLIYDEKVVVMREDNTKGRDTQFKSVLAIGLLYKF